MLPPNPEDGQLVPEMSKFTPTEVVITRSMVIRGEEDINYFFQEGWPFDERNGIYIKVGESEPMAMSRLLKDRVEPFGFEGDEWDLSVLETISELIWDNAIGLSVKGSVTALLILHTLF